MRDLELPTIPAWTLSALCAQADPDAWFPQKGESNELPLTICARCPVQPQCLEAGLSERYGIWGGLTGYARQALKQQRRRAQNHTDTGADADVDGPIAA